MNAPEMRRSLETKVEAGVLSVQFDGGHWLPLMTSVKKVLSVEDRGGDPRAGSVTYLTAWGIQQTESFFLRTPKRGAEKGWAEWFRYVESVDWHARRRMRVGHKRRRASR